MVCRQKIRHLKKYKMNKNFLCKNKPTQVIIYTVLDLSGWDLCHSTHSLKKKPGIKEKIKNTHSHTHTEQRSNNENKPVHLRLPHVKNKDAFLDKVVHTSHLHFTLHPQQSIKCSMVSKKQHFLHVSILVCYTHTFQNCYTQPNTNSQIF